MDFNWRVHSVNEKYTDPPFITKKAAVETDFGREFSFEKEPTVIQCFTYEDFENKVEKHSEEKAINIDVKKANSIREGIVTSASASGEGIRISYEPSLLIVLSGYGTEELIMEMERETDRRFLRVISPNTQYSRSTAKTFRQMGLPYALNIHGLDDSETEPALQSVYYPRYTLDIPRPDVNFGSDLSSDELQLKMKGLIYDSVIESYEKGYEMVVFEATIKNLKALQAVLDEMMPLPVKLCSYPLWRDD